MVVFVAIMKFILNRMKLHKFSYELLVHRSERIAIIRLAIRQLIAIP